MILIIGYGNPLRGDDAVGQVAAADLARLYAHEESVHVRRVQQLTPDLAETIAKYELVILIDARLQALAGQVFIEDMDPADGSNSPSFSHHMQPVELLALSRALYQASPRMVLAGISASAFDVGQPLSPEVERAVDELIGKITGLIQEHRQIEA